MEQSMKELVGKAAEGDQQAIAVLYERTNRKAYYLALQLVKDQDQAQDILQDAYLKVFTNLGMLQQPENFQGWLDTIVINKSKDYLKKKKPVLFSQMAVGEEADSEPDFEDESGYFSPEKRVDYGETKRLIQEMIDRLPEAQRMAVVLYYLENLPVARIAKIMECSEGTVKSRLNYGRKSIKEQVLALEKKGTKLYCMPLVPFLYWMFRQQVLSAVVPGAVGAAVVQTAGAGAVGAGMAKAVGAGNVVGGTGGASAGTASAGAASAGTASAGGASAGQQLRGERPRGRRLREQHLQGQRLPGLRPPELREKQDLQFLGKLSVPRESPLWRQPVWASERRAEHMLRKATRRQRRPGSRQSRMKSGQGGRGSGIGKRLWQNVQKPRRQSPQTTG